MLFFAPVACYLHCQLDYDNTHVGPLHLQDILNKS